MNLRARLMNRICWAPSDGGGAPAPAPAPAPTPTPTPTPAPAPAPTPAPIVAFAEQLPEAIRGEAAFRDIKDLAGLATGFLHAQKMIGHDPKNLVVLPAADDADAWAGVYGKLGRPEKADGYQVTAPAGVQVDPALQSAFLDRAHTAGLNQKQVETLYAWWNETNIGAGTAAQAATAQQLAANTAALKTEWGAAFDQNLDLANKAVSHYGGQELFDELTKTGLVNSPNLVKALAKLGKGLSEDGVIGKGGPTSLTKSPGEARQEINALKGDKAFTGPWLDAKHPGHADAVTRMQTLYQMAYPET